MAQVQFGDLSLDNFSTALNTLFSSAVKISSYSSVTIGHLELPRTMKIQVRVYQHCPSKP